jgi:Ca2+/Na+ antiporter
MLKAVLRLHSVAAASYAVVLLFFPRLFWQLTAKDTATDFGLSVAQLLGAPMVLMTLITWIASGLSDAKAQRQIGLAVAAYLGTGFVVTLWQQLQGKWGVGGWSSPVSYLLFFSLYAIALFRKPAPSSPHSLAGTSTQRI